jgi:hypothetical protein|tara:strand:+ start:303 stop:449 length:147 start_codon:yes stop_codon:yes gene_type:complete
MKKKTLKERLIEKGFKMTPENHPIYNLGPSIYFVSKKPLNKKNDESND